MQPGQTADEVRAAGLAALAAAAKPAPVTPSTAADPPAWSQPVYQGFCGVAYVTPAAQFGPPGAVMDSAGNPLYDDSIVINFALTQTGAVRLGPYQFTQLTPIVAKAGTIEGMGLITTLTPGAAWSGAAQVQLAGQQMQIRNLRFYGGTGTTASNPAADAIGVASGAAFWWIRDCYFDHCNGWRVNAGAVTGATHGEISGNKGEHNTGGILIAAASNQPAQVNISDDDCQNCEVNEVFRLLNVTDILISMPNGSQTVASGQVAISILGSCQTIRLHGADIGGCQTGVVPVLAISASGGNSPTDVKVTAGTFQDGGVGVLVSDSCSRIVFGACDTKRNKSDGWQWTGTGTFNRMDSCGGNLNNQSGGTGYDINVTGTTHLVNDKFAYVSGGVTAGRFLAAGNHYTEANPPAALTTAGAAPGGW